jgi:hypothetical protein
MRLLSNQALRKSLGITGVLLELRVVMGHERSGAAEQLGNSDSRPGSRERNGWSHGKTRATDAVFG